MLILFMKVELNPSHEFFYSHGVESSYILVKKIPVDFEEIIDVLVLQSLQPENFSSQSVGFFLLLY